MAVLTSTAQKEGLSLPTGLAAKLAAQSGRNMRRALLMLEAAKVQQYPFSQAQPVGAPCATSMSVMLLLSGALVAAEGTVEALAATRSAHIAETVAVRSCRSSAS